MAFEKKARGCWVDSVNMFYYGAEDMIRALGWEDTSKES